MPPSFYFVPPIMALTDIKCKTAKTDKNFSRFYDTGGLYLEVTKAGGKYWRMKYRFEHKERRLSFGVYPAVGLKDARLARDKARLLLDQGINPRVTKNAESETEANTFEAVSREWYERFKTEWSETHQKKTLSRLKNDVLPWLGKCPISSITPKDVLDTIRRVEARGAIDSAHRIRQLCSMIFRYAVTTGGLSHDPADLLKGALPTPEKKHHSAIINPTEFAILLKAIDNYQGTFVVRCALKLTPIVFQRTKMLRHMEWIELDFQRQLWTIPKNKMKSKVDHIVPLSRQALTILKDIQALTGNNKYVFSGERDPKNRCISENTIRAALISLGYDGDLQTGHGFRASARTMLDEHLHERVEHIEHQLAHRVKDPTGRAYNRTSFLDDRKIMMQRWADFLDGLKMHQQ